MLKIRLIPSLLLRNGRCVKGVQFANHRDVGYPVTAAKVYEAQGADELLFLDIDATSDDRETLYQIVTNTAEQCFMPLTAGGGVRSVADIRALLRAGADKITVNTAAFERPELIKEGAEEFGAQCIVVSIDHKASPDGGADTVVTNNGIRDTGMSVRDWALQAEELGAGEILLNSVVHDGRRDGYAIDTIRSVSDAVSIPVIASGGVGTLEDLVTGVTEGHASAVAAASLFHFTDQSVIKAHSYMKQAGLDVRMA
jgi:imidazole glycerol-phosphate synthase subunit HisF